MNRSSFALLIAALTSVGGCVAIAHAQSSVAQSAQPMIAAGALTAIRVETRIDAARKQRVFVARVDLRAADVEVRVARGGADPDGDGPYQTTLQPLSQIAQRENFDLAVNGDFFVARATQDVEGAKSGYVAGKWASVLGPAATDGDRWASAAKPRPVLWIDAAKKAGVAQSSDAPDNAQQIIAGSDILLQNGQRVLNSTMTSAPQRHPRSAVGLSDGGQTLVIVVVDGRDASGALGMTLSELTDLMRDLGCSDALNLDGGGSSELLLRDVQSGRLRVLNRPSDGRERAIANGLGVSIRGSLRAPGAVILPARKP